jgi:hypothetical protein
MMLFNEAAVREVSFLRIIAVWRLIFGGSQFKTSPE